MPDLILPAGVANAEEGIETSMTSQKGVSGGGDRTVLTYWAVVVT
jgi:hypothetical protein